MARALIGVDLQKGFSEKELPVKGASQIVPLFNRVQWEFDIVILSGDQHPPDHDSFKIFPVHCVAGTEGAEFIAGLDTSLADAFVKKGQIKEKEAFSAFDGQAIVELGDGSVYKGTLDDYLTLNDVCQVYICGLATDYCVKATALDANRLGFKTFVIHDVCRAVATQTEIEAWKEMLGTGIEIIDSEEILA